MSERTSNPIGSARLSEDERDDLAQLARRNEHRNRPTGLVALALLVLLFAGLATGLAWRREAQMKKQVAARHSELARLVDLTRELESLREQESSSDAGEDYRPIADILTRLESHAVASGLESPSPPQRDFDGLSSGLRRVRYRYTVSTPSAEALLRWARAATSDIPGLRVHRLRVQPPIQRAPDNWRFDLDFARIERLDNG